MDLSNYNIYIDINRLFNTIFLPNIKYIIFFSVIFIIVSSIIFVVISYIILKLLKMKIDNNNILFYKYNKILTPIGVKIKKDYNNLYNFNFFLIINTPIIT